MPAPQSPQRPDVEAIEARAKAASPGPWTWEGTDLNGGRQIQGSVEYAEMNPILVPFVCKPCDRRKAVCLGPNEADSAFIVAARADIPALVAYARRLEARVTELEREIDDLLHEDTEAP